jgi:hypothetical protein
MRGQSALRNGSAEKPRSSFQSLRTNGGAVEIIQGFSFMLSLVEACLSFSAEPGMGNVPLSGKQSLDKLGGVKRLKVFNCLANSDVANGHL